MSAWWVPLVVWGAGAVPATPEQTALAITWAAPEECPLRERFEAELRARTPKVRVAELNEKPGATLDVKITKTGQRYLATSKLRVGFGGLTTRELKGSRCQSVIGALSLTVALLIDPEGARTGAITVEDTPPPPVEPPPPEPSVVVEPPKPIEPVAAPEPEPPAPVVVVAPTRGEPPPLLEVGTHFELLVHGGFNGANHGTPEPAFALTGALDSRWVRGQLTALFLPPRNTNVSGNVVESFAAGGRFEVLAQLRPLPWFTLGAGPSIMMLGMHVSAIDAEEPRPQVVFLAAPGLWLQARVNLGAWRIALEGGPRVHLLPRRFEVEGCFGCAVSLDGKTFTDRTPPVFAEMGISVGRTIP